MLYDKNFDYDLDSFKIRQFLNAHSKIAKMGEIVVSNNDKSIIGTTGLNTCYGIVLYDRINRIGIVGHANPSDAISILHRMLKMVESNDRRLIEYAIVSGYRNIEKSDYDKLDELHDFLFTYAPKNIKLIPFLTDLQIQVCSNILAYEFAFNVISGKAVTNLLFLNNNDIYSKKYK